MYKQVIVGFLCFGLFLLSIWLLTRRKTCKCTTSTECSGDMVCLGGQCVDKPPTPGKCTTPTDCSGDMVCLGINT